MLLKHFNQIKKMVLWAPAIGYTAENSLPPLIHLPLKNIISIFDIKTTPSLLRNIATPTLLLRGETDAIVVKENLILVKNSMPRASLQEIANMGHSPESEEQLSWLINCSIEFFTRAPL